MYINAKITIVHIFLLKNAFLQKHPDMVLDEIKNVPFTNEGYLEIFQHIHNSDGFFVCRMKKQESV